MPQPNTPRNPIFTDTAFIAGIIRPASLAAIGAGAALVLAVPVTAAPVGVTPFSQPSGSGDGFTYSDGYTSNGLFGDPTVIGSTFQFTPSRFFAGATNGGVSQVADTLTVTLTADAGRQIDAINLLELGDYSIVRGGAVDVAGFLILSDLDTATPYFASLSSPGLPLDTSGSAKGGFTASATVDLPDGVTRVKLVLNNILTAIADPGGSAFIQKKLVNAGLNIEVVQTAPAVPEPTTAVAVLFGGAGLLVSRRRCL